MSQFALMKKYLEDWSNSYMLWNMVLDETGLSTGGWAQCSPVVVNKSTRAITYNPQYYTFKHFSYFVTPGSSRVGVSGNYGDKVAFTARNGDTLLVVQNSISSDLSVAINFDGKKIKPIIPAYSWNTFTLISPYRYEVEGLAATGSNGHAPRLVSDPLFSATQAIILDGIAVGDTINFTVPNVQARSYRVKVGVKKFNSRAIWQCLIGRADNFAGTASNVGTPQDDYSTNPIGDFVEHDLGTWTPGTTSDKSVQLKTTGKNSASQGYTIAIDYIRLIPM
jgi:hypothetical protein